MKMIGFIGGGVMGEAMLKGILASEVDPKTVLVCDHKAAKLKYFQKVYGVETTSENEEVAEKCESIILAVKPQNLDEIIEHCTASFRAKKKLLISVLAGVTTMKLEQLFPGGTKVIRAMPNTPAVVGAGAIVLAMGKYAKEEDIKFARSVFGKMGSITILPEKLLNAVTGLSGSGPAFVALIIEALTDGGVLAGLPREVAVKLALDTVAGTVIQLEESGMHPAQLKDKVTSPGGTTIYGMLQLEKSGVRGTIMEAVRAAAKRAEEL